jgi:hypothetical protein
MWLHPTRMTYSPPGKTGSHKRPTPRLLPRGDQSGRRVEHKVLDNRRTAGGARTVVGCERGLARHEEITGGVLQVSARGSSSTARTRWTRAESGWVARAELAVEDDGPLPGLWVF